MRKLISVIAVVAGAVCLVLSAAAPDLLTNSFSQNKGLFIITGAVIIVIGVGSLPKRRQKAL
ncbi:MAG TPA: hypothetical protein VL576_00725 [Candidatus Paceibacterota bacterium]|jgi:hypothetical protein|nr:hypothetical protein [Candidatus Paceibacterota bacterium]